MYWLLQKLLGLILFGVVILFTYQNHKKIGKISQKSREYFIKKHCDDESPYGLWKMEIYKDDEKFKKYNNTRFWIEEIFYIVVLIIFLLL